MSCKALGLKIAGSHANNFVILFGNSRGKCASARRPLRITFWLKTSWPCHLRENMRCAKTVSVELYKTGQSKIEIKTLKQRANHKASLDPNKLKQEQHTCPLSVSSCLSLMMWKGRYDTHYWNRTCKKCPKIHLTVPFLKLTITFSEVTVKPLAHIFTLTPINHWSQRLYAVNQTWCLHDSWHHYIFPLNGDIKTQVISALNKATWQGFVTNICRLHLIGR